MSRLHNASSTEGDDNRGETDLASETLVVFKSGSKGVSVGEKLAHSLTGTATVARPGEVRETIVAHTRTDGIDEAHARTLADMQGAVRLQTKPTVTPRADVKHHEVPKCRYKETRLGSGYESESRRRAAMPAEATGGAQWSPGHHHDSAQVSDSWRRGRLHVRRRVSGSAGSAEATPARRGSAAGSRGPPGRPTARLASAVICAGSARTPFMQRSDGPESCGYAANRLHDNLMLPNKNCFALMQPEPTYLI